MHCILAVGIIVYYNQSQGPSCRSILYLILVYACHAHCRIGIARIKNSIKSKTNYPEPFKRKREKPGSEKWGGLHFKIPVFCG